MNTIATIEMTKRTQFPRFPPARSEQHKSHRMSGLHQFNEISGCTINCDVSHGADRGSRLQELTWREIRLESPQYCFCSGIEEKI